MTTLDPTLERLQSYIDGELSSEARVEVERALETDASLRDELERLLELRRILAAVPDAFEAQDPGELAFERVRRSIHDSLAPTERIAPARRPAAKSGAIRSAGRSRRVFFGAVVAFAAAAAVFVVSFGVPSTDEQVAEKPESSSPAANVARRLNGTEIVRVEFGKMSGTYWEQNEGEERVAVVWIDDTFPEEVGRP